MICNTCNDTGLYPKPHHANGDIFEDLFGSLFCMPCPHCAKGGQERRDREQRVQARKAEKRRKAQEAETYRLQAEAKWRREIWEVIQGLIAPCQEALSFENLDHLDHRHKRNHLVRLKDKVHLAQEWALNEALDIPDDGTLWSRSHPNMLGVKIVSLDDREERLKWVREKVPFALKAHEDYYHALDNYPVLYQIEDALPSLRMYIFHSLPAYANDDIYINQEYQKLSSLVEAYKSGVK